MKRYPNRSRTRVASLASLANQQGNANNRKCAVGAT